MHDLKIKFNVISDLSIFYIMSHLPYSICRILIHVTNTTKYYCWLIPASALQCNLIWHQPLRRPNTFIFFLNITKIIWNQHHMSKHTYVCMCVCISPSSMQYSPMWSVYKKIYSANRYRSTLQALNNAARTPFFVLKKGIYTIMHR